VFIDTVNPGTVTVFFKLRVLAAQNRTWFKARSYRL
jgi:hypothetical protein